MIEVTSKDKVEEIKELVEDKDTKVTIEHEDKVLEVVGVGTENKEEISEGIIVDEELEDKLEPPANIALTEMEYGALTKTLSTITELKKNAESEDSKAQINLLELSIWDDMVKRFGFDSVESAQSNGYTFGLKRHFVIECTKK